ncbi:MAG TPA: N-acetylneuraminate synthase family protein [Geminicoccus sp.]|jgi:N-acetylneuraminate synthase/sialic acid synthase|uniref:N-acetylneuraminate synthase family protein n=1 Tax=Geminicoccus sp. TaxID=2024832 RepID=UPI002E31225D|nr:N-acetylneuraminate synthase family protein [Geminicoccus sp.]HEX2528334.1 N-acetylneuraminate synthase family protein [Geminicoccus sp.]
MSRELVIAGRRIADDTDTYVIAEVGHNHQGSVEKCKEMIDAAVACGCDAVKLQKRENRSLFTKQMYESSYNSENAFGSTYGEHREALEFDDKQYVELANYCKQKGISFFSTAFDFESADFLHALDMPAFKIASGDIINTPLLEYVAKLGKPMIVSTGGATMDDVKRAYETIMPINRQLCILQCTAGYPPAWEELNLRVIETYRKAFPDIVIGFSSHDSGISMPLVGYVLGSRMVEKHFTLDRTMKGTDHAFSLEPVGMRKLVRDLRRARVAMGDGVKKQYKSEEKPLFKMAKKLVAARDLPAGHVLSREDIAIKSPNDGLPPYQINAVIGQKLTAALSADDNISFETLARA